MMTNDRRNFLKKIAAGAFAASVGAESVAVVTMQPKPAPLKPEVRTWKWLRSSNFKQSQDAHIYVMTLTAERSDGNHFYVAVPMYQEDFQATQIGPDFQNALLTLETFRDCACGPSGQCDEHREMFPPFVDQADDDDE